MIVDSHAHIWRPTPPGSSPISTIVSGEADISAELFREQLDQHGVDRAVLVQPVYPGEDNSYIADTAAREPDRYAAVCVVDPRSLGSVDRLVYWARERGCRGLRLRPKIAAEEPCFGDPATFPLWDRAGELGVVVSLLCSFDHLGTVARLAELFPDVSIVVDHLAHPPMPLAAAGAEPLLNLAQYPRVFAKLSGFYHFSGEDYPHRDCIDLVRALDDRFGPERLLWGSDFPHVTQRAGYGPALAMVESTLSWLSADERNLVLGENALRLYWP